VRVILDTNVLVSGVFYASGPPGRIVVSFIENKFELVISPKILTEYIGIITKLQSHYPEVNIDQFLNKIFRVPDMYVPGALREPICQDPEDDKFIACAIVSKTKIIVSGDKHLLDVSGYRDIEIIKPKRFVEKYLQGPA